MMRSPSINIAPRIAAHQSDRTARGSTRTSPADRVDQQRSASDRCPGSVRDRRCPCALFAPTSIRLQRRLSRRRMLDQSGSSAGGGGSCSRPRARTTSAPRRSQAALNLRIDAQRNRGRDRRLAVRCAGRRTGAASRPGAAAVAEFSADRRHHRPVPHHRPPLGRKRVSREFATDTGVRSVQPNFRYVAAGPEGGLDRRRSRRNTRSQNFACREAHTLAHGANVTIAVIDSGIDVKHPELANTIADSFDALGSKEGPHVHGTGVAGAIVAHARLMGSAPAARILAIRAFAAAPERRGKHVVRYPEEPRLRRRAWRADRQYELRRPEGCADRTRHRRHRPPRAS